MSGREAFSATPMHLNHFSGRIRPVVAQRRKSPEKGSGRPARRRPPPGVGRRKGPGSGGANSCGATRPFTRRANQFPSGGPHPRERTYLRACCGRAPRRAGSGRGRAATAGSWPGEDAPEGLLLPGVAAAGRRSLAGLSAGLGVLAQAAAGQRARGPVILRRGSRRH